VVVALSSTWPIVIPGDSYFRSYRTSLVFSGRLVYGCDGGRTRWYSQRFSGASSPRPTTKMPPLDFSPLPARNDTHHHALARDRDDDGGPPPPPPPTGRAERKPDAQEERWMGTDRATADRVGNVGAGFTGGHWPVSLLPRGGNVSGDDATYQPRLVSAEPVITGDFHDACFFFVRARRGGGDIKEGRNWGNLVRASDRGRFWDN